MRKINVFSVFVDFLFSILDIKAWGIARFRKLMADPETMISKLQSAKSMTDEQLLEVITIAGIAALFGGLQENTALEYGVRVVQAGQGITPIAQFMRYLSIVGNPDTDKHVQVTLDMTFEQFVEQFRKVDPLADRPFDRAGSSGDAARKHIRREFDKRKTEIVEAFEITAEGMPEFERERYDWHEIEVPIEPSKPENTFAEILESMFGGSNFRQ